MLQLLLLDKSYPTGDLALKSVSLQLASGEVLGLIGPSGAGKSTLIRCINRLVEPSAVTIMLDGQDLGQLGSSRLCQARRQIGMIFQEYALVERLTVMENLLSGRLGYTGFWASWFRRFDAHDIERAYALLDRVGLGGMENKRADALSGGQRQRVGIARALALNPALIVLDEPVSALDVSIQAGVVNLLEDLQSQLGLSYLFIAHDLSVVRHISDTVAVMYLGKLMEIGPADEVYNSPSHPYTQALLSAIPEPDPITERQRQRVLLQGDVPSPINPPSGCRFRTRCPIAQPVCAEEEPALVDRGQGHPVACHFAQAVPVTVAAR